TWNSVRFSTLLSPPGNESWSLDPQGDFADSEAAADRGNGSLFSPSPRKKAYDERRNDGQQRDAVDGDGRRPVQGLRAHPAPTPGLRLHLTQGLLRQPDLADEEPPGR